MEGFLMRLEIAGIGAQTIEDPHLLSLLLS
jgi:hypothetical protein